MKHTLRCLVTSALLVLVGTSFSLRPASADTTAGGLAVLPAGSLVQDKSISEWTAEWWKWAFSQTTANNAFTDGSGDGAWINQSGPVFFLAGTMGGNAQRSFVVPTEKYLLVPLVVAQNADINNPGETFTEEELRRSVVEAIDAVDVLTLTIDGQSVPNLFDHRESTPTFRFSSVANNVWGTPEGDSGTSVADGYWVMLSPLRSGHHTIAFGGGITAFDFSVNVQANLAAAPEPGSFGLLTVALTSGALLVRRRRTR